MTQLLRYALFIALCACVCGACEEELKTRSGDSEAGEALDQGRENAQEADKIAEEELSQPNHAEARDWCDPKHKDHVGFEVSTATMLQIANELYEAGAPKVYVTGIDEIGQVKISASMVAELPKDPAARKKVFAWQAKFAQEIDDDPAPDVGQKYFFITLD